MAEDRLLTELSLLAARDGDRSSRAKAIAEAICSAGPYRWTGIYDVDVQKGLVSNVAWSGSGPPQYPTFPVTQGLTSRAIASRKTVNVGDVRSDADYLTALATSRSEIIVPVLGAAGDCVVGTIDVESERANAFDSDTQEHLERCANALRAFWSP